MKRLFLFTALVVIFPLAAAGCAAENDLAVPTLTETIPPTNTLVASETDTLPSSTVTHTPTQDIETLPPPGEIILPGETYILISARIKGEPDYYLINLNSGEKAILYAEGQRITRVYEGIENRCELVAMVANSGKIVGINLQGQIITTFYDGTDPIEEGTITWRIISPNKKWLAYIVASGYQDYYRHTIQNVLVRNLENENNSPIKISSNDGVWDFEWSPDSSLIAYNDYDDFGVVQLYASNPDAMDIIQISSNQLDDLEIPEIRWSIEGDAIAYEINNGMNGFEYIRVHRLPYLDNQYIEFGPYEGISDFWWHPGSILGIFNSDDLSDNTWKINWYQAFSGALIRSLSEIDTPSLNIFMPQPINGTNRIGYFNQIAINQNANSWFYTYDFNSGTFTSYQNLIQFADLFTWFPTILTFEEDTCFP